MLDPIAILLSLAESHRWILYVLATLYGIGFIGSHVVRIWFPDEQARTPLITKTLKTFDALNLFFGSKARDIGRARKAKDANATNQ